MQAGMIVRAANRCFLVLDDSRRELYGKILADLQTGTQHIPEEFTDLQEIGPFTDTFISCLWGEGG